MGLSRRFQNLVVDTPHMAQLFGNTAARTPSTIGDGSDSAQVQHHSTSQTWAAGSSNPKKNAQAAAADFKMERIRLPRPISRFHADPNEPGRIDCFPFADRKTMWADHLGRPFVFDAEARQLDIMPCLHNPKSMPLSLFVPNPDVDNDFCNCGLGSTLFVMERIPKLEMNCTTRLSGQFEALVYCNPTVRTPFSKLWEWRLLPPPPYVRESKHWHGSTQPEISSYALLHVAGDPHICISVKSVGTYCLDTVTHAWTKVGNWTLPFHGKVEYVPEIKLWFGFTADAQHLAAADLSAMDMDSQPQLVTAPWKELVNLPEEWKECKESQLVNLGSGRFCVTRFFHRLNGGDSGGQNHKNVAVFTGVEVVPCVHGANEGSGKVQLQMILHKSLCHNSNFTTIDAVL
ncbi:hypothetical protein E2562_015998 [Oryza meyeriana var. granulata]|uniref:DUF1618 domain-containing protein n=1 Tax=Oryza meyeriana var. granulata TaxID=110450 RepID=A0A6G1EKM0_9ORYZ|nr:hypothetical protein E2562_015998 [Oryza meyeriana var. granulata]